MKKVIFFLFVGLLTMQSCSQAQQLAENKGINRMDKIDKANAIKSAERYLSENGLDKNYSKIIKVEEGDWVEEKDLWIVYVKAKKTINGNLILTVDKSTGEIKNRGRTKW